MEDPVSSIGSRDMVPDQLSLPSSEKVTAHTRHGVITGGRVKTGTQVFLDVPYGVDVPRWTDPLPLGDDYQYPSGEYTVDRMYACSIQDIGKSESERRDTVGNGEPTESPFVANIFIPSTHRLGKEPASLPVKVFVHGGFLQWGSANNFCQNQQFFAAEQYNEVRVLLSYRLNVFGFLAAESPFLDGNWGIKDVCLGLEWIQRNIHSFGGDADNVHLSGQSAGAHLIHNLLAFYARHQPIKAPFITATLYSNAVLEDPPTLSEHQHQFEAFCRSVGQDPSQGDILNGLRDREKLSMETILNGLRELDFEGSFIPASGGWLDCGLIEYQRSGDLARDLLKAGVRCIVLGDVKDEDAEYKDAYENVSELEVKQNLYRFNRKDLIDRLYTLYPPLPSPSRGELQQRLGDCLGDVRVRLPVRLLAEDLIRGGMPVVRYTIEMVARHLGTNGLVPHSSDLVIHFYRLSVLTPAERESALAFNSELFANINAAVLQDGSFKQREVEVVLALESTGEVQWRRDWRLARVEGMRQVVRPAV